MNHMDIDVLLEEGEGVQLEFKRKVSSPEKIARTMVAFANTSGGSIMFGVDDDKTVVGVDSEKSEVEMIRTAGTVYCEPAIEPAIEIVSYMGMDVIVATVEESGEKPLYLVDGNGSGEGDLKVFIRVKDKTVGASREVIKILESQNADAPPLRIAIGEPERALLQFLEQHDRITAKQYSDLISISPRRASRILIRLVRAGLLRIHTHEKGEFYTRSFDA